MQFKFAEVGDIVYHWFAANLTTGEAGDGANPIFYVRKAGEAAASAPIGTGTPTLLTSATYASGLYEIALNTVASSVGEYATFCSLLISSVNPVGFVGSVKVRTAGTGALITSMAASDLASVAPAASALSTATWTDAKAGYIDMAITDIPTAAEIKTAIEIAGSSLASILEDTGTTLPATLATLAPASSALSTATWTDAKAAFIDAAISGATAPTANQVASAVWNEGLPGAYVAGKAGYIVPKTASDVATVDAVVDNIHDTDLPAVKVDTAAILVDTSTTLEADLDALLVNVAAVHSDLATAQVDIDTLLVNVANIDSDLATVDTVVDLINSKLVGLVGTGAVTWPYVLTDADTGVAIPQATVWVSSDSDGATVLASGITDSTGTIVFYLDTGTVYVWRQCENYYFTNPDAESVTA